MENENLEQPETEPEFNPENSEGSIYGKFKDAKTLLEAYNALQSEFTRKSQKLAEFQRKEDENAIISKNDSIENILDDEQNETEKYKKEIAEILENDKTISNLPNKNHIAFKIIKEAEKKIADTLNNQEYVDKYISSNNQVKDKIITEYLSSLGNISNAPKVISGNASNIYFSPSLSIPKTLEEAGEVFTNMLK